MRNIAAVLSVVFLLAMSCAVVAADERQASSKPPDVQIVSSPSEVKWGPAPPVVPSGAQAAVLNGDPFKDGAAYTLRLKMPDGYRIGPHWHPTDENVTVLSGTLGAGMGDKFAGKIERYTRSMKNQILLENYYLPVQLEQRLAEFVDYYNSRVSH